MKRNVFISQSCIDKGTCAFIPTRVNLSYPFETCIATLLLATKNADMVDDDTAVLEGPKGKTRDADWGFRYLHIVEKVKCQDVIYDHAVCSPSGKTLFQNPCIHIISSIFSCV